MKEETGITVVAAVGIVGLVVLAVFLIWYLSKQQNRGPQPGQSQQPNGPKTGHP
jgi:hypothetical protein